VRRRGLASQVVTEGGVRDVLRVTPSSLAAPAPAVPESCSKKEQRRNRLSRKRLRIMQATKEGRIDIHAIWRQRRLKRRQGRR